VGFTVIVWDQAASSSLESQSGKSFRPPLSDRLPNSVHGTVFNSTLFFDDRTAN